MKLLIVGDHPMVRTGLAALLEQADPDATILQAQDAVAGLSMAADQPDLDAVMIDLSMPGMDGFAAMAEFQRRYPDLPVIILSSSEDAVHIQRAMASGARGYIPKSATSATVLTALQMILSGEIYLPPIFLTGHQTALVERMTDRQIDILSRLSEGK